MRSHGSSRQTKGPAWQPGRACDLVIFAAETMLRCKTPAMAQGWRTSMIVRSHIAPGEHGRRRREGAQLPRARRALDPHAPLQTDQRPHRPRPTSTPSRGSLPLHLHNPHWATVSAATSPPGPGRPRPPSESSSREHVRRPPCHLTAVLGA